MCKGFISVLLIILALSCHPAKKIVTTTMPDFNWPELKDSRLNIDLTLPISQVEDVINQELKNAIAEHLTFEDGYRISLELEDRLRFSVSDFDVQYNTPLHIKIFPFRSSKLFAEGSINLEFLTNLEVLRGQLMTHTKLLGHRWLSTPQLNVLGVRLPIESISDKILKKFDQDIVEAIDSSLIQAIDAPGLVNKTTAYFSRPVFTVDTTVQFYVVPKTLTFFQLRIEGDQLKIPLAVELNALCSDKSQLQVTDTIRLSQRTNWLPESQFFMQVHLSQHYLNKLVKASVENQSFGSGVTKVIVYKVDFQGYQKEIGVRLTTGGAYKGDLEIRFIPAFNTSTNKLYLENLVLIPSSNHAMSKTLMDLFRSLAENQLKKALERSFNDLLNEYNLLVLELLNTKYLDNKMELQGDLIDFELSDFISDSEQCIFNLQARLNLSARVMSIR